MANWQEQSQTAFRLTAGMLGLLVVSCFVMAFELMVPAPELEHSIETVRVAEVGQGDRAMRTSESDRR